MTRTPGGGKAMYQVGKKLQEENAALKAQLREAVQMIKEIQPLYIEGETTRRTLLWMQNFLDNHADIVKEQTNGI